MSDKKNLCSFYIEELCKKFRGRGIVEKVQSDSKSDGRRSERMKKGYSADGRTVQGKKYKSGIYGTKRYMNSDDFAEYYKDSRGYNLPNEKSSGRDMEKESEVKLQSKKEARLAIRKLIGEKLREAGIMPPDPKKLLEKINSGFPEDEPKDRGYADAKKPKRGILSKIALVSLSLLLVVISSVMVSRAESDVARLESELDSLTKTEAKLNADLEVKNNMVYMKEVAESEYGMVGAEYVASRYIYIEREDKIEVGTVKRQSAFITLLEALGLKEAD